MTELRRLRTRYAAGSSTVVNPRVGGSHGDMAQALALAVFEQRGVGSAFPFAPDLHVVPAVEISPDWHRFEALYFGATSHWLELAVDYDGNLLVVREFSEGGLPSQVAATILEHRGEDEYRTCFAGPSEIVGRLGATNTWTGAPLASVLTEFSAAGVPLSNANDSRPAGFVRIGELLRPDPERRFPDWHPRSGETGSPSLFIFDRCLELVEQVSMAPLDEDDEPLPRAAISQRWEQLHGAVPALRFAAMSRPSPSQREPQPPDNPRVFGMLEFEKQIREQADRGRRGRFVRL